MAEETTAQDAKTEDGAAESSGSESQVKKPNVASRFTGFLKRRWGFVVLAAVLLVHTSVVWYLTAAHADGRNTKREVSLGEFEFVNRTLEHSVRHAEFDLHLSLLDAVEDEAREQLDHRRFRVQQDVEQLLRQAHGADFADPKLTELKRRLQEQVNESLGMRAIRDVIITDLNLEIADVEDAVGVDQTAAASGSD